MTDPSISKTLLNRLEQAAQQQGLTADQLLTNLLDQAMPSDISWKSVFDESPTNSIVVDARQPDYPIVAVNRAFIETTGYSADEAIGQNCRFLQGTDRDQPARKIIRHALETGIVCSARLRNYRKDGTLFWNDLLITPIHNDQGDVTHFIANQSDASNEIIYQEKFKHSETLYQQFVETANEGIWAVDLEGQTTFVNQQMADMLGYTSQEMRSLSLWDLMHEQDQSIIDAYLKNNSKEQAKPQDLRMMHKDGHDIWVMISTSPLLDADGSISDIVGFISDITDRVEARRQLAESEKRYRQLTNIMTDYAFSTVVDEDGTLRSDWVIGAYEEILGNVKPAPNSVIQLQNVYPDDKKQLEKDVQHVLNNQHITGIYRVYHQNGRLNWLEMSFQPVWDEQQQRVVSFYGATKDITARMEAQSALKVSESRFRAISELTSDYAYSYIVKDDGSIQLEWVTAASIKRITGFTPEASEARGGWAVLAHPDDFPEIQASLVKLRQRETQVTSYYRIITKSGEIRYMESLNRSVADQSGKIIQIIGSARDITEEYIAQQEMAESEARFRAMANNAPVLIWMSDTEKACNYFNETWLNFTGRSTEQELGFGWAEGVHPDDYERCLNIYTTAFDARESFSMTYRLRRHDDLYRWVRDDAVPRFLPDGTFAGYIGTCLDVTDQHDTQQELERLVNEKTHNLQAEIERRIQAESELVQERDMLQNTMQTSPSAIFVISNTGIIQFASEAARELLFENENGIIDHDVQNAKWDMRRLDGKHFEVGQTPLEKTILTGKTQYDQQITFLNGKGERRILSLNLAPIYNENGEIKKVIATAQDITLRKEWEQNMEAALEQERQFNKIRSGFISILTHEFKTPLSIIQTSCDILRNRYEQMTGEQIYQRISRIEKQGQRLNEMVDEILQLNNTDQSTYQLQRKSIDFKSLIYSVVEDLLFAYHDKVTVHFDLKPNSQNIMLDETLMKQLMTNLIGNAIKYTPEGKSVHITAKCTNNQLELIVKDNGIGIPSADIPYLFDEFFRASNIGMIEGTGIGLATVKRAVSLQHGTITVESIENEGTTFFVTIPIRGNSQ